MIKVVFVGCGNITNRRHIPAVQSINGIEILGVIGISDDHVNSTAKITKARNTYVGRISRSNFPCWLTEADLVVIGTPPQTHLEILNTILHLNSKAKIIVEKPFSLGSHGPDVEAHVYDNSQRIFVMHNFQFAAGFLKILNWVSSDKIGDLTSITGFQSSTKDRGLPVWHEDLPAGLFWDEAVHFYYLLESLVGGGLKVVDGTALFKNDLETPASVTVSLIGSRDIPIQINMNFNASLSEWGLVISGTKGTVLYDLFRDIPIYLPHDGQHLPLNILRTSASFVTGHLWGFFLNGFKYISGNLHYGVDEVIKRVVKNESSFAPHAPISLSSGIRMVQLMDQSVELFRKNSTHI
jgi:scyllo-inositol 2-dehydrogenase (NADP+)